MRALGELDSGCNKHCHTTLAQYQPTLFCEAPTSFLRFGCQAQAAGSRAASCLRRRGHSIRRRHEDALAASGVNFVVRCCLMITARSSHHRRAGCSVQAKPADEVPGDVPAAQRSLIEPICVS